MRLTDSLPNQKLRWNKERLCSFLSRSLSCMWPKIDTFKQAETGSSYILMGLYILPLLVLFAMALIIVKIHKVGLKFRIFKHKEDGGVLILVGILLTPIISMLGLAVDTATGFENKRRLQAAVDAAARAGLANGNGDVATITTIIQKVFAVNTTNMKNIIGPVINVNTGANVISVSASVKVNNTFMNIGGIPLSTYNASSSVPLSLGPSSEVAIVYEVSGRSLQNNFHQIMCDQLIKFVTSLPNNVMVSITPIATEFLLDSKTTANNALFSHLDMGSNDEMANPGFFPLNPAQAWNTTNYGSVTNPFYTQGQYAVYPTDPGVLISNTSPGMCKLPQPNYPSCSSIKWPTKCPSTQNISCSQVYSYASGKAYPILPLTLNKTLAVNYIKGLKEFAAPSDGFFPSLLSWGWRTIDPNWNDFWLVNSELNNTSRSITKYPQPYGSTYKSMILVFNGNPYWDDYKKNISSIYNNKCGNSQKVVNGLNHWLMTGYGMVPVPTNRQSFVNDITCENRWYKTMDKGLGLNLSDATNYNSTVDASTYAEGVLNAVGAKFYRICNNIKMKNIDIFVLSSNDLQSLSACSNSSSNTYTINNSATSISKALDEVRTKIVAKSFGNQTPPSSGEKAGSGSGGNDGSLSSGGESGKGDGKSNGDGKPTGGASGKGDGKGDNKSNGDGKPTGGASGKGDGKGDHKSNGDDKPTSDTSGKGDGKSNGDGNPTGGASGKGDGKGDNQSNGDGKPTGGASGKGDGKGDNKSNGDGKPTGGAS
ncbi:MAG: hypothetical protein K2Y18_00585, partial [Alphaproteobacteria bacterium]|nr:hypothetical protein [Alphaproteobacteria bacterium]